MMLMAMTMTIHFIDSVVCNNSEDHHQHLQTSVSWQRENCHHVCALPLLLASARGALILRVPLHSESARDKSPSHP